MGGDGIEGGGGSTRVELGHKVEKRSIRFATFEATVDYEAVTMSFLRASSW